MASIKAKLSSVELYTSQCGDDYSTILNIANDVLSRSEKLYIIVQEELEKTLDEREVEILIKLNDGNYQATAIGNDL